MAKKHEIIEDATPIVEEGAQTLDLLTMDKSNPLVKAAMAQMNIIEGTEPMPVNDPSLGVYHEATEIVEERSIGGLRVVSF